MKFKEKLKTRYWYVNFTGHQNGCSVTSGRIIMNRSGSIDWIRFQKVELDQNKITNIVILSITKLSPQEYRGLVKMHRS